MLLIKSWRGWLKRNSNYSNSNNITIKIKIKRTCSSKIISSQILFIRLTITIIDQIIKITITQTITTTRYKFELLYQTKHL